MSRLQSFETKYEICKDLTFKAITCLLGEFENEKYYHSEIKHRFDFSLINTLDLLILPLLAEDEYFTINNFIKSNLYTENEAIQFKSGLNCIDRFEDLIELIILLKSKAGNQEKYYDPHEINIHLSVTYFIQLKRLNEFNFTIRCLMADLYNYNLENMSNPNDKGLLERLNDMNQEATLAFRKVAELEAKAKSKQGLLSCMNLIFRDQTQYYSQ